MHEISVAATVAVAAVILIVVIVMVMTVRFVKHTIAGDGKNTTPISSAAWFEARRAGGAYPGGRGEALQ